MKKIISTPLQMAQLSATEKDDEWKVSGYATVFGNENCYGFKIEKGAYADLVKQGVQPPIFFNHKSYAVPLGKWTKIAEDDVGLWVEGVLTKGVSDANDVYHAIKAATVDGLSVSIGWSSKDTSVDDNEVLSINKISSLYEISIVTVPADSKAHIVECLSADEIDDAINEIQTVRDLEAFLRENAQLSKRQAGCLVSKAKAAIALVGRDDQSKELAALFDRINSGISTL